MCSSKKPYWGRSTSALQMWKRGKECGTDMPKSVWLRRDSPLSSERSQQLSSNTDLRLVHLILKSVLDESQRWCQREPRATRSDVNDHTTAINEVNWITESENSWGWKGPVDLVQTLCTKQSNRLLSTLRSVDLNIPKDEDFTRYLSGSCSNVWPSASGKFSS